MNIFAQLHTDLRQESLETLAQSSHVRIERIVSHGHSNPDDFWYDQSEDEWVIVLQGQARLRLDGQPTLVELGPGDYLNIPAHQRHRVEWTVPDQPTIWLAVFYS